MKSKCLHGFLGAFLCAFIGILVAGTWDIPWIAFVAAIIGWVFGYHGDRIISGIKIAWRNTKEDRIYLSVILRKISQFNFSQIKFKEKFISVPRFFVSLFRGTTKILGSILFIWNLPYRICVLLKALPGFLNLKYIKFKKWYNRGLLNKARFIRAVVVLSIGTILFIFMYNSIAKVMDPIGSIKFDAMSKYTHEVTALEYYLGLYVASLFSTMIPILIVASFYFREGRNSKGQTSIRKRLRRGIIIFCFYEVIRFIWIMLLLSLFVSFWMGWGFFGIFTIALPTVIIAAFALISLKVAYGLVKLQKDYGLSSLIIGLLFFAGSYYWHYDSIVSDVIMRLSIALATGFLAGIVTIAYVKLFEIIFNKFKSIKRIALIRGEDGVYNFLIGAADITYFWLLENLWRFNKKLMPANTANFKPAF